jgi:7tm Odorant receptor
MVPMVLVIFLPCYFGNELSHASSKLSTALFHSDWIIEDNKFKKSMLIFMENSKKDLKISAFNIFHLNLMTFGTIGNTAYSLFAVLRRVNSQ